MKLFGQILLWAGFLSGSLATVFNAPSAGVEFVKGLTPDSKEVKDFELQDLSEVEVPEDGWQLIPWVWYSISAVICVIGIVLLRISKAEANEKSEKSAASLSEIKSALDRAIASVESLNSQMDKLPPSKMTEAIDGEIADNLRIFADGRDSMTTEFGLAVFADVMSQFAAGERAINRAWSAAADGYVDEAAMCVERGLAMLKEAKKILGNAK